MLEALEEFMPPEVRWTHPEGGLFLWVRLPDGLDVDALIQAAMARNVAFVPGYAFFTSPNPPPTARLNFSCMGENLIVEGIRRLAEAIKEIQLESSPLIPT
jgi:2-aminoadipate transaminase